MQGISLRMARPDDAAAMTVMQRASWLAAYGGVLGADMLAQLAVTEHLQIWQRRLAETGPRPMLLCQDEVVIGLLYWQPETTGSTPPPGSAPLPASRPLAPGPRQAAVAGGGDADAARRL